MLADSSEAGYISSDIQVSEDKSQDLVSTQLSQNCILDSNPAHYKYFVTEVVPIFWCFLFSVCLFVCFYSCCCCCCCCLFFSYPFTKTGVIAHLLRRAILSKKEINSVMFAIITYKPSFTGSWLLLIYRSPIFGFKKWLIKKMCYHIWLNCVFIQNYYNLINLVYTPLSRQQSAIKIIFPFYKQEQNIYLKAHNQPEISHDQLFWHDFIVEECYSHKYQMYKNCLIQTKVFCKRFFFPLSFYCQCIITTYLSDNRNHLMFLFSLIFQTTKTGNAETTIREIRERNLRSASDKDKLEGSSKTYPTSHDIQTSVHDVTHSVSKIN